MTSRLSEVCFSLSLCPSPSLSLSFSLPLSLSLPLFLSLAPYSHIYVQYFFFCTLSVCIIIKYIVTVCVFWCGVCMYNGVEIKRVRDSERVREEREMKGKKEKNI